MKNSIEKFWKEYRGFLFFIALMFMFRSSFADWSDVPTESMVPTIIAGDRIVVNKMAYDIRLPFTHISLLKLGDPKRGDIIVFDSKVSEKRLIKRVAGVPGDIIAMRDNVLFINGEQLNYQIVSSDQVATDWIENLTGVEHIVRTHNFDSGYGSFEPVVVPEGHFLALGDNRDNSRDSRAIGFVPREEIVGRSRSVAFSLDYDNYFLPRVNRFFRSL